MDSLGKLKTLVSLLLLAALLLASSNVASADSLLTCSTNYNDLKELRYDIASYATSSDLLGIPYVANGCSTSGFDCSGFVVYVYAHFGFTLSHYTGDLKNTGTEVSREDLFPGDLVFFRNYHHVGIYLSNGYFVHASSGKGCVLVSTLSEGYYKEKYSGARRIFWHRKKQFQLYALLELFFYAVFILLIFLEYQFLVALYYHLLPSFQMLNNLLVL